MEKFVRLLSPNRPRWEIAAVSAVVSLALTFAAAAQSRSSEAQMSANAAPETASGSYLAARHASVQRDAAAAAAYFRTALRVDPKNNELLERTFVSVLAEGNIEEAARLADRVLQVNRNDRVARLVVGVRALKQRQYAPARQNFAQSIRGPVTDLVAAMLNAWAFYGAGDVKSAVETLDKLVGPDWYGLFKDLHTGLIFDAGGNRKEAVKRFERAYKLDNGALRVVQAYGSVLSRLGQKDEALKVFDGFDKALPRHPLIVTDIQAINRGEKLVPLVETAQAGAAEALYGLGAALGRRGGEDLGLVYLQLALYLAPQNAMALLSLADIYEGIKKPELAIRTYERVPAQSSLRRNADIQQAINLDTVDRTGEAKARLQRLVTEHPDDFEALIALGNILRARKSYADCADIYGRVIAQIQQPTRANWTTFYFRGICYERAKKWSAAEADLKKALELYPDQPHALNYLGYSWIDQGINLDDGMAMIRRAVEQRPDDGYIVDSLGWAYYRLGNYEEAVKHLERAIELKPEDPTINDHLGDVYWRVGRTLEAEFQWSHARDLKTEPDELKK
ncbi:MAG: tetratricopeptide repeat protein, partial [Pseudorhodoplanes sp.]|nr:tetratricopeptide repeat protein [Pseudorhodoplanes sp.]